MAPIRGSLPATRSALLAIAAAVADLRRTIGWSQAELGRRAGLSQAWVSVVEAGKVNDLTFDSAARLLHAMGARLVVGVDKPFLGDRVRQRDVAHIRCVTHAARRMERAGWLVAREVEVGGDRSRGWIDLLAYHVGASTLLVIEVKTEIHDLGSIERTLGWYEREAWAAARRLGWRPRAVNGCLLLLATASNDARARTNRPAFDQVFRLRAAELAVVVAIPGSLTTRRGFGVAMIDPLSRRERWLIALGIDGRRTPPPYVDYASFVRAASVRREYHGG